MQKEHKGTRTRRNTIRKGGRGAMRLPLVCKLQAVHSGADLQSAAASVVGYDQVSMKGKAIKVPAVPQVATAQLTTLLEALPKADEEAAALQGKAGVGGVMQTLTEVGNLMAVRRALLPALARGNKGCGERLRYWISRALPCVSASCSRV